MTQPNKEQLLIEWQIATGETILALLQWQRQLELWRFQQMVTDFEFMTAYGDLCGNIGFEWPDNVLQPEKGIDQLREVITGVDPSQPWGPIADDFDLNIVAIIAKSKVSI